jgi:NTP pyrophosphatase (non-canonical NTP hydrolase)
MRKPSELELHAMISGEIRKGNDKHGHAPLATPQEVVSILAEELGEFAAEVNQRNDEKARHELLQIAAIACNYLMGTGPHYSELK